VFGDGDPNQGIEEERWKLIGQYISSNGGVVAAEELAPYLDIDSIEKIKDDESYILPVLLRFDGQPVVDEEGNILYRFHLFRRQLPKRVREKNMLGKDGQNGLVELRNFSRRKDGNSVKLPHQREHWSLVWVALISLELLFSEPC
jgi:hypothetical protein